MCYINVLSLLRYNYIRAARRFITSCVLSNPCDCCCAGVEVACHIVCVSSQCGTVASCCCQRVWIAAFFVNCRKRNHYVVSQTHCIGGNIHVSVCTVYRRSGLVRNGHSLLARACAVAGVFRRPCDYCCADRERARNLAVRYIGQCNIIVCRRAQSHTRTVVRILRCINTSAPCAASVSKVYHCIIFTSHNRVNIIHYRDCLFARDRIVHTVRDRPSDNSRAFLECAVRRLAAFIYRCQIKRALSMQCSVSQFSCAVVRIFRKRNVCRNLARCAWCL